jgi:hypothetical protein
MVKEIVTNGTRVSALANLVRSTHSKKLKEVCQLEGNSLKQSLSTSLSVETSRFLTAVVEKIGPRPYCRRCSYNEQVLVLS